MNWRQVPIPRIIMLACKTVVIAMAKINLSIPAMEWGTWKGQNNGLRQHNKVGLAKAEASSSNRPEGLVGRHKSTGDKMNMDQWGKLGEDTARKLCEAYGKESALL